MTSNLPLPLVEVVRPSRSGKWFSIDTGSGTSRCFTDEDKKNFGFENWLDQSESVARWDSCQACVQSSICTNMYKQTPPTLQTPRKLYSLGPKISVRAEGALKRQPYQFPLDLDYPGSPPKINLAVYPWMGPP